MDAEALKSLSVECVTTSLQFGTTSIDELKGAVPIAILFYQADFNDDTAEWIKQVAADYDEEMETLDCKLLLCSTDSKFTHFAWRTMPKKFTGYEGLMGVKVPFAMVGDKSLRLSEGLGVLDRATGFAKNAAVILDGEGMLRRREVREYGEQRFMVSDLKAMVDEMSSQVSMQRMTHF